MDGRLARIGNRYQRRRERAWEKNEEAERVKARARKPEPNVGLTQQNNITLYYLGQYFSESLHQLNRGGNLVVLLSGTQSDLSNLSKRVEGFILIPGLGDLLGFYQIRYPGKARARCFLKLDWARSPKMFEPLIRMPRAKTINGVFVFSGPAEQSTKKAFNNW